MLPNEFTRSNSLTTEQFRLAFSHISRKIYTKNFVFLLAKNKTFYSAVGVIVAKKKIRSTVRRNLCKRLIKEAFRINKCFFNKTMVVAIATSSASQAKRKHLWGSINLFIKNVIPVKTDCN